MLYIIFINDLKSSLYMVNKVLNARTESIDVTLNKKTLPIDKVETNISKQENYSLEYIEKYNSNSNPVNDITKLLNWRDDEGRTMLHIAAIKNDLELIHKLIGIGLEIDAKDNFDMTALHYTAIKGHKDIMSTLLYYNADVNAKGYNGNTALQFALKKNDLKTQEILVKAGAIIVDETSQMHRKNLKNPQDQVNEVENHTQLAQSKFKAFQAELNLQRHYMTPPDIMKHHNYNSSTQAREIKKIGTATNIFSDRIASQAFSYKHQNNHISFAERIKNNKLSIEFMGKER